MTPLVGYTASACCIVLGLIFLVIPMSLGGCSRAGECNAPYKKAPFLDCHGVGCCNNSHTCLTPESYFGGCKVDKCPNLNTALEDYGFCSADNCQKCTDQLSCSAFQRGAPSHAFPHTCAWGVGNNTKTPSCMQQPDVTPRHPPWCHGLTKETCVDAPITPGCSWGYPARVSWNLTQTVLGLSDPVCGGHNSWATDTPNTCGGETEAKCLIGGTGHLGLRTKIYPDGYNTRCYWVFTNPASKTDMTKACHPHLLLGDCLPSLHLTNNETFINETQCQDGCIWIPNSNQQCTTHCSAVENLSQCTPEQTSQTCIRDAVTGHRCVHFPQPATPPQPPAPRPSACPAECKASGLPIYAFWLMICLGILLLLVGCAVAVSTFHTGASSEGPAASDDLASPGPSTEMGPGVPEA